MGKQDEAKEIFRRYKGNRFQMMREGENEYYNTFNISNEIESKWLSEIQFVNLYNLNNTSNNKLKAKYFSDYADIVVQMKDIDGLKYLLKHIDENMDEFDSNTLFRNINAILNALGIVEDINLKLEIVKIAIDLLTDILNKPISISETYKENGKLPSYLMNEKITLNVQNTINYWKGFINKV